MAQTTIVVPCYNEAERLLPAAFLDALSRFPTLHLRFVNDGSTDRTSEVLRSLATGCDGRISIQELNCNSGKAEAVRQGIVASIDEGAAYVGYWDADLSTPLSELTAFIDMLECAPDLEVVFGSRVRLLGRDVQRSTLRHLSGRVFATAASWTLGLAVYDTQCGAKLFRVSPGVRTAFAEPFLSRWIFDVEILARLRSVWERRGIEPASRVVELPLQTWIQVDGSKLRPRDVAKAAIELTAIAIRYP
ncbi:MAG: glycosyltransferase [Myxococcota bacterium]